jgi:hypothetical protein
MYTSTNQRKYSRIALDKKNHVSRSQLGIQPNSKIWIQFDRYHPPTRTGPAWWVMAHSPYV